jgi:hypothetical protein
MSPSEGCEEPERQRLTEPHGQRSEVGGVTLAINQRLPH